MSSFFTTPASQRKRKREDIDGTSSAKRRTINPKATNNVRKSSKKVRDESISGSGSEEDGKAQQADDREVETGTDSDEEDETGAERRLRLAEKYLQDIKGGVDDVGFDAEQIDRDLIAERLQEDVVRANRPAGNIFKVLIVLYRPKAKGDYIAISWMSWTFPQLQKPNSAPTPSQ